MTPERSWFLDAIGEVGQFAKRLAANFARALIASEVFAIVLGAAIFSGASAGPPVRAQLLALAAWLVVAIAAVPISVNLAVVLSIADTIRAKGLARRAMDALFGEVLGITEQKPEGDLDLTRKLHGMPITEARTRLRAAARKLSRHRLALAMPGPIRWLIQQAQRLVIWATVRVTIAFATQKTAADKTVDLLAVRASLTTLVDSLVTEKITAGAIRLALLVCLGACVLALLALRYLP